MSKLPSDMKTYHFSSFALFFVHYLFQILEANFCPPWPFQKIAGTRSQIPLGQILSQLLANFLSLCLTNRSKHLSCLDSKHRPCLCNSRSISFSISLTCTGSSFPHKSLWCCLFHSFDPCHLLLQLSGSVSQFLCGFEQILNLPILELFYLLNMNNRCMYLLVVLDSPPHNAYRTLCTVLSFQW